MRLANLVMEFMVVALAVIGGYSVAGWIGVSVVIVFFGTMIADIVIRMRSPRMRAMREIAAAMREYEEHVHTDACLPAPDNTEE